MQPTKKQLTKLKGSWWGARHEGPVLPKRNASSLRSCMEYDEAKRAAEAPQEVETFGALAENAKVDTSALREKILKGTGVDLTQDPLAVAKPTAVVA